MTHASNSRRDSSNGRGMVGEPRESSLGIATATPYRATVTVTAMLTLESIQQAATSKRLGNEGRGQLRRCCRLFRLCIGSLEFISRRFGPEPSSSPLFLAFHLRLVWFGCWCAGKFLLASLFFYVSPYGRRRCFLLILSAAKRPRSGISVLIVRLFIPV